MRGCNHLGGFPHFWKMHSSEASHLFMQGCTCFHLEWHTSTALRIDTHTHSCYFVMKQSRPNLPETRALVYYFSCKQNAQAHPAVEFPPFSWISISRGWVTFSQNQLSWSNPHEVRTVLSTTERVHRKTSNGTWVNPRPS